jgi:hypothetical protein
LPLEPRHHWLPCRRVFSCVARFKTCWPPPEHLTLYSCASLLPAIKSGWHMQWRGHVYSNRIQQPDPRRQMTGMEHDACSSHMYVYLTSPRQHLWDPYLRFPCMRGILSQLLHQLV